MGSSARSLDTARGLVKDQASRNIITPAAGYNLLCPAPERDVLNLTVTHTLSTLTSTHLKKYSNRPAAVSGVRHTLIARGPHAVLPCDP